MGTAYVGSSKKKQKRGEQVQGSSPHDFLGTRSEHVRAYLRTHKNREQRKPTAVASGLAAHGVIVTSELVSQVKGAQAMKKQKKRREKNGEPANPTLLTGGFAPTIDSLLTAKKLLALTGNDVGAARKMLEAVKALQS